MLYYLLAAAAVSAKAVAPACVLTTADGSTFGLSTRPLWYVDAAVGWWYQLSPCATSDPRQIDSRLCANTPNAPAHQITSSECLALGALETRAVSALAPPAVGVRVSFTGGKSGRSVGIDVACADETPTRTVALTNPGTPLYLLSARGREGCPLACARDVATGAVCGGASRGACALDAVGVPHCACAPGFAPPACTAAGAATTLRASAPAAALSLDTLAAALPRESPSLWAALGAASSLLGVVVASVGAMGKCKCSRDGMRKPLSA